MDYDNVFMDSDIAYPVLFMPKKCSPLNTNSANYFIDLFLTSPNTEEKSNHIYSGICHIRLIDSRDNNYNFLDTLDINNSCSAFENNEIDQLPIILSETNETLPPIQNDSQVWIDPSRSPYVYNRCDDVLEGYTTCETRNHITLEQHNTYITQNIFNYNESKICNRDICQSPNRESEPNSNNRNISNNEYGHATPGNDYENVELDGGKFLPTITEEVINEKVNRAWQERKYIGLESENDALKQLMSKDIQSMSKQRKTILLLGHSSGSGQTIQNISYDDPTIRCCPPEVDNEVVIDYEASPSATPKKKKYRCDKCKKIFEHITDFRMHMVGNHAAQTTPTSDKNVTFMCSECGKKLKDQHKFEIHCLGHGDPDLECPQCHKVYASKFTLRAHLKLHNRKFPCSLCKRTYATNKELTIHEERVHYVFRCQYENCSFVASKNSELNRHLDCHIVQETELEDLLDIETGEIEDWLTPETGYETDRHSQYGVEETRKVTRSTDENSGDADSMMQKVMSNKMFLLDPKKAKKEGRGHKSCQICSKSFDRVSDLKRHLIEHAVRATLARNPVSGAGALAITCEICQTETFTKVDKYKAHLRKHAKLTLYQCTFCDKSFSDSSNFSKHKKIHGDSCLQCDLCQRKFNSKKMIAQHMEYHNKHKPIKCRYCSKSFHFESTLKKHEKSTHKKQLKAKYKCRYCDGPFKSLKDKWDHEWVVHNSRKNVVDCILCGTQFRKHSDLNKHFTYFHNEEVNNTQGRKLRNMKRM